MSTEQTTPVAEPTPGRARNQTSSGNNLVLSVALFLVLFGLFAGGLYVLSLFTLWTFLAGLAMCLVALFATFDLVPRFLT